MFYAAEKGYEDSLMQDIIDTGKVRYATREDAARFSTNDDSDEVRFMPRTIYVEDPTWCHIPRNLRGTLTHHST